MNTDSLPTAPSEDPSRRDFLKQAAAGAASLAIGSLGQMPLAIAGDSNPAAVREKPETLLKLSEHLAVFRGPINVGVVRDGDRVLLIDCGDGRVAEAVRAEGAKVEQVVFTHHHRDQACGAAGLAAGGAKLRVPAGERDCFDKAADYWNDPKHRWHLYNQHPHHLMLAESVPLQSVVNDGESFSWGRASIKVLATPGHTDGAVSYVVEVDGKRTVFCGDVIFDEGQLWELHSLQKGTVTTDYHGFLGAKPQLAGSLGRIKLAGPDILVPSHGRVMDHPARAINLLLDGIERCYDKYVAISALRHYFPKMFAEYADRKDHMAIRPGKPAPDCLRHLGTTWMLISKDKAAFVMDCGGPDIVPRIQAMVAKGEINRVEGLWVTHFHDDHVDCIPAFQKAFDCPCITDRHVADVIGDPLAWRLPCISPSKARIDRPTKDGESWQWREFRLTAYHFPGQTLYHAGLLVEGNGLRMFFAGDSFTMGGIDDYCAHNRNWLGQGVGFDRCVALFEKLRPTHIFNCHVDLAFDFTPEQCRYMRANLAEREKLFGQLFPWDHPNYGMDEAWVRCQPYEQKAAPGQKVECAVFVTNHSPAARRAACRTVLPRSLGGGTSAWTAVEIPPKQDGRLPIAFDLPRNAPAGRHIIAIDMRYDSWDLPQYTEAMVVV